MIKILEMDVLAGLNTLPDRSVHTVITSPPYWNLRDYGMEGQIGLEATPEVYIQKLIEVFQAVRRVLRDDGTLWLNIGDGYLAQKGKGYPGTGQVNLPETSRNITAKRPPWLRPKNLVGMPWRVAFALQDVGWNLRSDIIWSKPNPLPESAKDRPTKSHEYIFLLTKKPWYYYDAVAIQENYSESYINDYRHLSGPNENNIKNGYSEARAQNPKQIHRLFKKEIGSGKNKRTVWVIAVQPYPESHFATFPEKLVEPCIKAGTSERGCCSVCGAPWVRVMREDLSREPGYIPGGNRGSRSHLVRGFCSGTPGYQSITDTLRWDPGCTCSADSIPCTVLDPFGGSGTVAKVARDLARDAILIELNPEYVLMARRRLRAEEQLFPDVEVVRA